jgi:enamine deaminase RidA (YjgF/YER057c/UK114 family)
VGNHLYISGTTAIDRAGEVVGAGDPYVQTRFVIDRIREVLSHAGFKLADVVRTRLFVTQMARWEDYAKAHREAFEQIRPASSIVQVSKLVDPRLMIELEADAILGCTLIDESTLDAAPAVKGR